MQPSSDFETRLLQNRLARQQALLAVVGVVLVGALVWNLVLARTASRRANQITHMSAVVDSLSDVAQAQRLQLHPIEERLDSFGSSGNAVRRMLATKADRASVHDLASRLDGISSQIAASDSALEHLRSDLAERSQALVAAEQDSLAALRRSIDVRLAALNAGASQDRDQAAAVETRVTALEGRMDGQKKWTAVRDVATVTSLGMITAHVLSGR